MDFLDKETWHRLGSPFANMAMVFKIRVTEEDIDYINNIIKKDKVYNLINKKYPPDGVDRMYYDNKRCNTIVFYEEYYNSASCPKGVKQILFAYIGTLKAHLDLCCPNLLLHRRNIIERWFEIVRNTD